MIKFFYKPEVFYEEIMVIACFSSSNDGVTG